MEYLATAALLNVKFAAKEISTKPLLSITPISMAEEKCMLCLQKSLDSPEAPFPPTVCFFSFSSLCLASAHIVLSLSGIQFNTLP